MKHLSIRGPALASFMAIVALGELYASRVEANPANKAPRTASMTERAPDSGALIEPSRRMGFKGGPWDYEIRVALPASYPKTNQSYPVLWVTDGNFQFDLAVAEVNLFSRRYLPEMIVVSIGAPGEARQESGMRRVYDFTSTTGQPCEYDGLGKSVIQQHCAPIIKQWEAAGRPAGGAAKFLAFIHTDLRQALAKDYRMANDHILFGYSAGGFFCTYALLTRPDAFSRYICGSPNLTLDNGIAFRMEEDYAQKNRDMKAQVFLGAGEGEILEGGIVSAVGVVSGMARMAEILRVRNYPSLELHSRIFPGEQHSSANSALLRWGLRALFEQGK